MQISTRVGVVQAILVLMCEYAFTSDDYREPPAFLRKLVALRSRSKALRSHHIPLIVASSRAEDDGDAAKSHPHFD